jgi:hypothetical protein
MLDFEILNLLATFNFFVRLVFSSTVLKRGKRHLIIHVKPELELRMQADDSLGLTSALQWTVA